MKKLLYFTLSCLILAGCGSDSKSEPTPRPVLKQVEVLSVKPPKHFRLKYKVLETGAVHTVSSKYCSTWKNAVEGKTYMADITKGGCSFTKHLSEVKQ